MCSSKGPSTFGRRRCLRIVGPIGDGLRLAGDEVVRTALDEAFFAQQLRSVGVRAGKLA